MGPTVARAIARIIDAGDVDSAAGRALLEERYRALQRQIPLLYGIAVAAFLGLHIATGSDIRSATHPVNYVFGLVLLRLVHWVRTRSRTLPPEKIRRELTKTYALAALISLFLSYWGLRLWDAGGAMWQSYIVLFGSLGAIGCSYGLSSFPSAARLPLLIVALPFALRLMVSLEPAMIGIGFSLSLVTLITVRLINVQNASFTALVQSRSEIAVERERARRAEEAALVEKAKARAVADTDPLTGLANRRAFLAALEARASAAKADRSAFALALVDLDGFKPINDTFGHATGDAVLIEVGARLKLEAGADGLAARMGGDEFALLLPDRTSRAATEQIGQSVCASLKRPFHVGGREFRISGCCGLTLIGRGCYDVPVALVRGDAALYSAKQSGRGTVTLFSPKLERSHRRRAAIEKALRLPGTRDEVELMFQPVFDLFTHQLRCFEALARWEHPEIGPVSPSEFIPIAEQINVIEPIGETLLAKAAREAKRWPDAIRLSFNLSAVELCSVASSARILAILAAQGLDPARLQIEVTETALLVDFEAARTNLNALRSAGAWIVLDDFGAGHASISYLREMRFDAIKLDGSLIARVATSQSSRRLFKGVLDLCASLGVASVAEHIETDGQLSLLREMGCRDGQGFHLSRPVPAEAACALAETRMLSLPSEDSKVA